jgi:hypothetical protein
LKRNRINAVIDRDDLASCRRKYLRNIRQHREDKRKMYYLDETRHLHEAHTTSTVYTKRIPHQQFTQPKHWGQKSISFGLSTEMENTEEGRRLTVLHIGSGRAFWRGDC